MSEDIEGLRRAVFRVFREMLLDLDHDIEGCSADDLTEIDHWMECTRALQDRLTNVLTGVPCDERGVRTKP